MFRLVKHSKTIKKNGLARDQNLILWALEASSNIKPLLVTCPYSIKGVSLHFMAKLIWDGWDFGVYTITRSMCSKPENVGKFVWFSEIAF